MVLPRAEGRLRNFSCTSDLHVGNAFDSTHCLTWRKIVQLCSLAHSCSYRIITAVYPNTALRPPLRGPWGHLRGLRGAEYHSLPSRSLHLLHGQAPSSRPPLRGGSAPT